MGKLTGEKVWLLIGLGIFLLGLVFLVACQNKSAQEQMAEKAIGKAMKDATGKEANVDIQGGNIRIQTKDGTGEITVTNTWPDDLPGDVPRFSSGKIKGVNKSLVEGKKSWNVVLSDTPEGAFPKYVEEIKSKGWKIEMNMSMGKGGSVAASKANYVLMVMYNNEEKSGTITVSQNK